MKNSALPFLLIFAFSIIISTYSISCDCNDSDEDENEASDTDYVLDLDLACIDRYCEDLEVFNCNIDDERDAICYIQSAATLSSFYYSPNGFSRCLCDCNFSILNERIEPSNFTKNQKSIVDNDKYTFGLFTACSVLEECTASCYMGYGEQPID